MLVHHLHDQLVRLVHALLCATFAHYDGGVEAALEHPDIGMVFEEQCISDRPQELLVNLRISRVELMHVLRHTRLLLARPAQVLEYECVQRVDGLQGGCPDFEEVSRHSRYQRSLDDLHHQLEVKPQKNELQMILEELFNEGVQLPVQLVVGVQGREVLADDALEDQLAHVRECLIVVVLADRKVDVPARNEAVHHADEHLDVLVDLLVHVVVLQRLALRRQALELLHELDHEAGRLLVDDEAVDGPRVELEAITGIVDELVEELENEEHDFVIAWIAVDRQALLDDAEELGVEPVEHEDEVLVVRRAAKQPSEYVEYLHHLDLHLPVLDHGSGVLKHQDFVDDGIELRDVVVEV